ncbi:zinc knuckle CX2CX4HX4C containing protein [Tanacetum coccineum]
MLDSYTSSMCIDSWGRSSFARCLIEVKVDAPMKESITMGIPLLEGSGFSKETVRVEYEWKPSRCDLCKIFGHVYDTCPKNVNVTDPSVEKHDDGFQTVVNKRSGFGDHSKTGADSSSKVGLSNTLNKQPTKIGDISMSSNVNQPAKTGGVSSNPFDALNSVENYDNLERQMLDGKLVLVDGDVKPFKKVNSPVNSDNDSEVKEVFNETAGFMALTSLHSGSGSGFVTKSLLK